jgi:hypothetical protein
MEKHNLDGDLNKNQDPEMDPALAGPRGSTAAAYETAHKAQVEAEGLTSRSAVTPSSHPTHERTKAPAGKNEGEGNKTAGLRYDRETAAFAASGKVDAAAREAAQALDGPEGQELRDAEERARQPLSE